MISDYTSLQTDIRTRLGLAVGASRTSDIPTAIQFAEARFNLDLRVHQMVTTATLTLDANGEATLPADYQGWKRLQGAQGGRTIDVASATPEELLDHYPLGPSGGDAPCRFTIEEGKVRVRPSSTGMEVTLYYYASIPSLSDAEPTNWLLTLCPGIYLAGAMVEAWMFFDNAEAVAPWEAQWQRWRFLLDKADRSARYLHPRMRIRGANP